MKTYLANVFLMTCLLLIARRTSLRAAPVSGRSLEGEVR